MTKRVLGRTLSRNAPTNRVDPHGECDWWVPWYTSPWGPVPGDSGVHRDYQRYLVFGFATPPGGRQETISTEVDFEILVSYSFTIEVGGWSPATGDWESSPLVTLQKYSWSIPYPNQLYYTAGANAGVACRKLERCVRRCQRCSAWAWSSSASIEKRCLVGWTQYLYGVLANDGFGSYYCNVVPTGGWLSVRSQKKAYGPQPAPLNCVPSSVPPCGAGSSCVNCYPKAGEGPTHDH